MGRLATLANWPRIPTVEPEELAQAGFFCLGTRNEVRCFSCRKIIRHWSAGDNVMDRHNTNCRFIRNRRRSSAQPQDREGGFVSLSDNRPNTSRRQTTTRSSAVNSCVPLMRHVSLDVPRESQPVARPGTPFQEEAAVLNSGNAQWNRDYLSMLEHNPSMNQDLITSSSNPSGRSPPYSTEESGQQVRDEPVTVSEPSQSPLTFHPTTRCPIRPYGNQAVASSDRPAEGVSSSISGTVTRDYVRSEENRLQTLQSWPQSGRFDINRMAASGLFYTGKNDNIRCLYCSWNSCNLGAGLDPYEDHYELYLGKCPLLRGDRTDNVKRTRINSNSKLHIYND